MTHQLPAQARSIYRSVLRELPRHQHGAASSSPSSSLLSTPSPLQARIREYLSNPRAADENGTGTGARTQTGAAATATPAGKSGEATEPERMVQRARLEEAWQFTEYVRAQGTYMELLERYNPGEEMDEQERVRLTARRVGMDLPSTGKEGEGNGGAGNGSYEGNVGR